MLAVIAPPAFAVGGHNLLTSTKALPEGSGYVLFSVFYELPRRAGEPCLQIHLTPVTAPGADAKPKEQHLDACTGGWEENGVGQLQGSKVWAVFLVAVPEGEYEVYKGSMRFPGVKYTWTGEPSVVGIQRLRVRAGQLAYAGQFRLIVRAGGNQARFRATDHWFQDGPIVRRLRPDLDALEVARATWDLHPAR